MIVNTLASAYASLPGVLEAAVGDSRLGVEVSKNVNVSECDFTSQIGKLSERRATLRSDALLLCGSFGTARNG
jgi:hypothetical protein